MPVSLNSLLGRGRWAAPVAASLLLSVCAVRGQVTVVPPVHKLDRRIRSRRSAVPRPSTKPCVVPLFTGQEFADFTPKTFDYTPPADCKGPWSKVVFTADFTVTEGRQYDRTAAFYLGHASIYYGTTAEPRAALAHRGMWSAM